MRFTGRLFVVVFVLSCGGFVINSNSNKGQTKLLQTDVEAIQRERISALKPRPVSIEEFQERIKHAKTYHDVLKLFFEAHVKNSELDEIILANGYLRRHDIKLSDAPVEKRDESSGQDALEEEEGMDEDYEDEEDDEDYSVLDALENNIQELQELGLNECRRPRPEIVHVVDEAARHRVYYPDCTVVYRCRNVSGCCHNTTMECGPKRIQEISKTFLVMETIDENHEENLLGLRGLYTNQWMQTRLFENHTECGCMEVRGLPGCNKRCPEPLIRRNPDCICDCPDRNNFACVSIQYGFRALDQVGLRCIKLGECMPPKCDVGEFSLPMGYCPHRIENGRSIFYMHHHRRRRKKDRFNLRG